MQSSRRTSAGHALSAANSVQTWPASSPVPQAGAGGDEEGQMDVLTAINSRASATRLGEPGPTAAQLETILAAGIRAPDHGRLSPWRFVVLSGPKRDILANAMVDLVRRQR